MKIVVGTRGSTLARSQTERVAEALRALGHEVELQLIVTRGDRERQSTVPELGGKGLFTAELEQALLDGRVQAAVHSYKDLPTEETPELCVAAIPERTEARDALVAREGSGLDDLTQGARVGTASVRRRALLLARRPDLRIVALRGNVDTRLKKVRDGELDAVVVAAAGLQRMGREGEITALLDFLPAPAQGALAVQAHAAKPEVLDAVRALHDEATARATRSERALLHVLGGGCSVPVGALAQTAGTRIRLRGCVASLDGTTVLEVEVGGSDPDTVGASAAQRLLQEGAKEILDG